MKNKFSASTLRILLASTIIAIGIASATGFAYGLNYIQKYAVDVSRKKVDAQASNGTVASLQKAQEKLDETKDVRDKLQLLKSDSEFPEFRIVDEVRAVAGKNGIQIESFDYGEANATGATSSAPPAQTSPTVTPTPTAPTSGGNTISLTVKLQSPVNYSSYLQFLYDLEQSLPILKVDGVSLSPGDSNEQVAIDQLTIQMYKK